MKDLKILHLTDTCTGCGACANICPKGCLTVAPDKEGFYYPHHNANECIECGLCEKTCHVINTENGKPITEDRFYIYKCGDEKLLEQSTSGGAFSLFADYTLSNGGVVFGSRYNGEKEMLEVVSTDDYPIDQMRKSKYVESYTNNAFSRIKNELQKGRKVLFCGTPCQVSGLKNYLGIGRIPTENLIAIDFVCHGVPSNRCFTEFKHTQESDGNRVVNADFRHKNFSRHFYWHQMTLGLKYQNGKTKIVSPFAYYNYYYRLFLHNLILRRSCFTCNHLLTSSADATIGDFWGIIRYKPEMDDNRGLSLIKIHDEQKVSPVFKGIGEGSLLESMPFEPNKKQFSHRDISKKKKARDDFFSLIEKKGYVGAVESHYNLTPIRKSVLIPMEYIKHQARRVLNTIKAGK